MKVLRKTGSMHSELLKKSIIKTLKKVFIEILNKLAPMKKKFVKEHQAPYMTKGTQNDIPAKILKKCPSSTVPVSLKLCNGILGTGNFPVLLKLADITPVFKKNNPLEKANYRPVSALSVKSKIFERIIQMQVTLFTKKNLSPYLCG